VEGGTVRPLAPQRHPTYRGESMRWLFAAIVVLHGLIHLMGPAKAFGWAELEALTRPISRGMGVVWGLAGLAMLATAALYLAGHRGWWGVGLAAALLSQAAIVGSWSDARFGTVANLILLGMIAFTLLTRGEGGG